MPDHWLAVAIGTGALALFATNRVRVEVVGLLVLLALVMTGLVSPAEAIDGFANEAVITIAAMFVLTAGLSRTGALDRLGRWLAAAAGGSETRLLLVAILLALPLSAFVNNTPIIAVMVPIVLGICRQHDHAPSRLLMPISFASQLGGTLTLIGTSTNLLVAGIVAETGLQRFELLTPTGPALLLMVAGVVYLLTIGRWLLPTRKASRDLVETYELRDYLATLRVPESSPLAGRTLRELDFVAEFGLEVLAIERDGVRRSSPGPDATLVAGDRLLVEGKVKDLANAHRGDDLAVVTDGDEMLRLPWQRSAPDGGDAPKDDEAWQWAELIVPPRSPWIGRTLGAAALRGRFGITVLGLLQPAFRTRLRARGARLGEGDLLLVQARPEELQRIHASRELSLLGALDVPPHRRRRLAVSVVIMALVIVVAAVGALPILVTALAGCAAMLLTGCVRPDEAYEEIDWSVLILIATLLPLGLAMQRSGAAAGIADAVLSFAGPLGPAWALFAIYLLTSVLTELVSNAAAAIVLTPIAIAAGPALGVSPLPFVIAVMLAGSNSFMTPIGYQTNLFVFGPGGYRFGDFVRVGGPLCALLAVLAAIVIPWFFPFLP